MMIAFLISLVAAYLLPATPAATTCGHWLDAATARDRVGWVEINCESLPCPCLPPDPRAGGGGGNEEPAEKPESGKSCTRPRGVQRLVLDKDEYPNIRKHFRIAVRKGWPRRLIVNRPGADARRDRLLEDIPTKDGFDRDEYPPAAGRGKGKGLERGRNPRGWKAHVRYVPRSENRSHGAVLGARIEDFCNGHDFATCSVKSPILNGENLHSNAGHRFSLRRE
jgi:hypothetical protein